MSTIVEVRKGEDLQQHVSTIRNSFQTVATELELTEQNNPSNPAFINSERLLKLMSEGVEFYKLMHKGKPVGFIAIEQSKDDKSTFYIEKVAVLPEFRHNGFGRELMDSATQRIIALGGTKISVALIDKNRKLKEWYKTQGYSESGFKEFTHLPFSVCFMIKELA